MFKHNPNGKGMVYVPNAKGIIAPVENAWYYEKLFFEVVIVMVHNKIQFHRNEECYQ